MEVAEEGKEVIVCVKEWRWWQLWDRSPSVVIVCWVVGGSSCGGRSSTAWRGTLCVEKAAYVHLDSAAMDYVSVDVTIVWWG